MPFLSTPVAASHLPGFFSKLPVRLHVDYEAIQKFTLDMVFETKKEGTKAYKHAYHRHALTGPELNLYALAWCEAEFERLKLLIEFVELIWAHDDVAEEIDCNVALNASEQLRRAMYEDYDSDPLPEGEFGLRVVRFRSIRDRMNAISREGTAEFIKDMEEYLPIDKEVKDWQNMDEYLAVRGIHAGNGILTTLIRWTMDIHLSKEELSQIQPFVNEVGSWLGLMNDYFSWKKERNQKTDRVVNATQLLMKAHNLDEEAAADMLRGLLVKQEVRVLEMYRAWETKSGLSKGFRMYLEGIVLFAGATFYWSMLAPRYQKPIEE
ncbi:isoprenoid synthase domain-containing protein [Flagelloscypha sp. PMI_526]|nr:isoprenoid synthase domain-containing protein [Flagelloscypha sp. PMI_526]